jgi:hypothetical protein
MNKHLRAHVGRRGAAIDRLRSMTAGAVVAGAAGTIGFGVLAAATFSGKSSAQAATTDETRPTPTQDESGGSGTSGNQGNGSATNLGNTAIPTAGGLQVTPTPRPTRVPKPHAATGGSG